MGAAGSKPEKALGDEFPEGERCLGLENFGNTCHCNSVLQEAQRRMEIKKPPQVLVIHLKRFKFIVQLGRCKKLSYRVVFPMELKLGSSRGYQGDPDNGYIFYESLGVKS